MASTEDPFKDAKANIRDTVKWLTATFAALAAVVIGGSPVSGLGALPIRSGAFLLSAACLLAAFVCICAALRITLEILRPEAIFRSDLYGKQSQGRSTLDWRELQRIRQIIDDHAEDLLPYNCKTLDSLGRQLDEYAKILGAENADPTDLETAREVAAKLNGVFDRLLVFAQYLRLQLRLHNALPPLLWLGIGALISLTTFGIVVNSTSKAPDRAPESIVILELPSIAR